MLGCSRELLHAGRINRYVPKAEQRGCSASTIGIAFKLGLLVGFHQSKERKNSILVKSFRELLEYANEITKKKIIELDEDT